MKSNFLLFLFGMLIALGSVSADCNNGITVDNGCSCYSGYTGVACDALSNGTCPAVPAAPLRTTSIGEFVSDSIANNALSFTVVAPTIYGRYFDYIQFSPSLNCSYPGNYITKGFRVSNCSGTFTASIPFANIANDCDFVMSAPHQPAKFTSELCL